jgi:kynurenine formamidase
MIAELTHRGRGYRIDLARPLDISLPLRASDDNVRAWHVGPPVMEPVRMGDWVGAVAAGAPVNFRNVFFNPHGHGTHTECVGHITPEIESVNGELKIFFVAAQLISVSPATRSGDRVITRRQLEGNWREGFAEALVIRTLPNESSKRSRQYTGTNPPYLEEAAALWMRERDVRHLLIDLPSVDREEDGGALAAHRAFWNYPDDPRHGCTITELVYAPDEFPDGDYFLELQVAPFENDASPSRPVLYAVIE